MQKILIAFIFLFSNSANAQWSWAKKFGGKEGESVRGMAADDFGNCYIAINFNSDTLNVNDTSFINKGCNDLLIIKVDPDGNIKWMKHAGTVACGDVATGIATDKNGNVYVAGHYATDSILFDNIILHGGGYSNVFLVKYDSTGVIQWGTSPGGSADASCWATACDESGNVYITGNFAYDPITFGTFTLTDFGFAKMFVAKYDSNGNVLWAKGEGQVGTGLATDKQNNVFAVGYYNDYVLIGSDSFHTPSPNYSDIYIIKYDSAGTLLWDKSPTGTGLDVVYSVTADNDGNAYITGYFGDYKDTSLNFGNIVLQNNKRSDIFVTKYLSNGQVMWAKSLAGDYEEWGFNIKANKSGGVFVTGYFQSDTLFASSQTFLVNGGWRDAFLANYSSSGNLISLKGYGGYDWEQGGCVDVDGYGNLFLGGFFESDTINFGTNFLVNSMAGTGDAFLAKMGSNHQPGIGNGLAINYDVWVYPNPSSDQIFFALADTFTDVSINLFAITDQLVLTKTNIAGSYFSIDVNNLAAGIYIAEIIRDENILRIKVVKQ